MGGGYEFLNEFINCFRNINKIERKVVLNMYHLRNKGLKK